MLDSVVDCIAAEDAFLQPCTAPKAAGGFQLQDTTSQLDKGQDFRLYVPRSMLLPGRGKHIRRSIRLLHGREPGAVLGYRVMPQWLVM